GGGGRPILLRRAVDYGKGAIALAVAAGVATHSAATTRGYTPDLGAAMLGAMGNLAVGAWVSTDGRRHGTLAFLNFCFSFLPLMIAMARGGEFDPEVARKIYNDLLA
ncbi:unnamed protein product, partial [Urochloa humidicola]